MQYSFSLTTFSPSGKLVQIEYALAAVMAGATSLGIKATNGVVVATERKVEAILGFATEAPGCTMHIAVNVCVEPLSSQVLELPANCCILRPATHVILLAQQVPSILVDETTVQKISLLTPNIGVVYSGMGPDSRVLIRKARKQAQAYYRLYKEHIPVAQLVREVATVMQEYTRESLLQQYSTTTSHPAIVNFGRPRPPTSAASG